MDDVRQPRKASGVIALPTVVVSFVEWHIAEFMQGFLGQPVGLPVQSLVLLVHGTPLVVRNANPCPAK